MLIALGQSVNMFRWGWTAVFLYKLPCILPGCAHEAKLKDDLGIDSLDFVDIVVIVEKNFGFKIKPEEMQGVTTLTQFCDYIESKVG